MGYYMNPVDGRSKEEWLEAEAVEFDDAETALAPVRANSELLLVVLMDNGPFTAAGVCYCQSEVEAFTQVDDPRTRRWFVAPVEKLTGVVDGLDEELKRRLR